MKIQQIRNATITVQYAGKKFLVDPMLADKGAYSPFPAGFREDVRNPIIDLPMSVDDIIKDVDAVILTHLHQDHYDDVAKKVLPKSIKIFVQDEKDAKQVMNDGFQHVEVITENTVFEGIQLVKTQGEHGRGEELKKAMGEVCGIVFNHLSEKTLYVAGDTVWYDGIQNEINAHTPEVIVVKRWKQCLAKYGLAYYG